jgi:hypothetical protein
MTSREERSLTGSFMSGSGSLRSEHGAADKSCLIM